jgi:endoglucanase
MNLIKANLVLTCLVFFCLNSYAQSYYGVNMASAEFAETKIPGNYNTDYIYPPVSSLTYYQNKGIKVVRLPFLWERMQPKLDSALNSTELARMDVFIAGAKARGISVILDVHNYGRRNVGGTKYIISNANVPVSSFVDFWVKMATHFKGDSTIFAYGMMNEPNSMAGTWFSTAQAVINGIRTVDTVHTIFVPGDGFSAASRWVANNDNLKNLTDPFNNLVYEAHQYFDGNNSGTYTKTYDADDAYPNIGVDRVRPFLNWLKVNNKKGFMGEYGVPGDDPRWNVVLDNFLASINESCVGGTYWAGGPWWGTTYALSIEPSGVVDKPQMNIVENYLNCTPPVPPAPGPFRDPDHPADSLPGLVYIYYQGAYNHLPDFNLLIPSDTGTIHGFDITQAARVDSFGYQFVGYVHVPADDYYTFYLGSDEGSQLFIGDTLFIDNNGAHSLAEYSSVIGLKKGLHRIKVIYFERRGSQGLNVKYSSAGITKMTIPDTSLFYSSHQTIVLGTSNGQEDFPVSLYPNPLKSELTLLTNFKGSQGFQLVIQNMLGEQVFQFAEVQAEGVYSRVFDLKALASGCYVVRIIRDDKCFISKIIKN